MIERVEAAATRPLRHRVLRPTQGPEALVYPGDDAPEALHAAAREDGRILVVGSIAPDPHPRAPAPGDWRIRGMAAEPAARGRGLGTAVLSALLEHAWSHGAQRVWCNAREPAVGLYARAGMAIEGELFEIVPIGPHYVMALSAPR